MNLITNTDTSIYPYKDNNMTYDLTSRQYLLTVSGVKDLLGANLVTLLGTDELAQMFNLEISEIVYNFIYSYSTMSKIKYKRWLIAKDEDLREIFRRILTAQTRYAIRSGANLLGDMHGVNIEKGKALDLNSLRGSVEISSQALKMLQQSGLLYNGNNLYFSDYEEDSTY